MNKLELWDYWKLLCGICILIGVGSTEPIHWLGYVGSFGFGGGGVALILDFVIKICEDKE